LFGLLLTENIMPFQNQLKAFKTDLDRQLKIYLDLKIRESRRISSFTEEITKYIADLTLRGGKRVRAALLYNSYLAHGGTDREMAMKAAMSMELAETYLLIHDDIMDNGTLRRGGLTIHEIYRRIADEQYHNKVHPRGFGIAIGMCAGNIASALSYEILTKLDCLEVSKNTATKLLSDVYVLENYGQSLDMISQVRDDVTQKDIIQVHTLKTMPYTFDAPIKIGAILAGATDADLAKLDDYTLSLGIAYQVQDDILGLFGSAKKTGKQTTSDLKEGKKTLLILDALDVANAKQRETIVKNLGNKRVTVSDLKKVRAVVEDTGSLAKSKKLAENLARKAIKVISNLNLNPSGKEFLVGVAQYIIAREY